jgi:anti-sigma factor RsiW
MTCAETRNQFGAYVLGGLEPQEAADVRAHLNHCGDCAREQAELAGLPAMLDLIDAGGRAGELDEELARVLGKQRLAIDAIRGLAASAPAAGLGPRRQPRNSSAPRGSASRSASRRRAGCSPKRA